MRTTFAIVPAAGRGLRMVSKEPKQFLTLAGKPILVHTIEKLASTSFVTHIVLVVPADFVTHVQQMLQQFCGSQAGRKGFSTALVPTLPTSDDRDDMLRNGALPSISVVVGGKERQDSVLNALQTLPEDCEWVMIHDGVRPFVSLRLLEDAWRAAHHTGAAIAALSVTDTVKRVHGQQVVETLPRDEIKLVQTPQIFRKDLIVAAYAKARQFGWSGTDDACFVERLNFKVQVVEGETTNIKVTTPADLDWAAWFLSSQNRDWAD